MSAVEMWGTLKGFAQPLVSAILGLLAKGKAQDKAGKTANSDQDSAFSQNLKGATIKKSAVNVGGNKNVAIYSGNDTTFREDPKVNR